MRAEEEQTEGALGEGVGHEAPVAAVLRVAVGSLPAQQIGHGPVDEFGGRLGAVQGPGQGVEERR